MIKEKEKYFFSNLKQQKITNKLSQGYKIKTFNSQIFRNSNSDNECEMRKDDSSPIDDSSHHSSGRHNSHFATPESNNEFQKDLRSGGDFKSDNLTQKKKPFKKVGFEPDRQDTLKSDQVSLDDQVKEGKRKPPHLIAEDLDEDYYAKDIDADEFSLSLIKSKSEFKNNRTIRDEMEEYAYNMHADEYTRQQEIDSWNPKKQALYKNLDRLIDQHVDEIIDHVFCEKELQEVIKSDDRSDAEEIWKQRFRDYALKAIRLVKPSQRLMRDTMDINDYVEIELIEHDNDSKCKYINGCVIKNNIADRRMQSDIKDPKILLIGNSIGLCQEESCVDIETYVSQEEHYIDILMDRLNQVNPNVILVEKDISRKVLSKIRELNITVVTNVKRKCIEKIARCTETLIIPSVNLIEKHLNLGSCKRFYLKLGQSKNIKEESKIMRITQSLLYFDG